MPLQSHFLAIGFRNRNRYYPTRTLAFHFASEAYRQTIQQKVYKKPSRPV